MGVFYGKFAYTYLTRILRKEVTLFTYYNLSIAVNSIYYITFENWKETFIMFSMFISGILNFFGGPRVVYTKLMQSAIYLFGFAIKGLFCCF